MWKANGKTTTYKISWTVSEKTLSLEETMDLSRDRNEMSNLAVLAFIQCHFSPTQELLNLSVDLVFSLT
jgi:hypothetical protein